MSAFVHMFGEQLLISPNVDRFWFVWLEAGGFCVLGSFI